MKHRLTIAVLTLAVLALLTGHFVIGMDYMEQRRAHRELENMIAEAAQVTAQTPAAAPGLQADLAAAEAELIAAGSAFPQSLNSTGLINDILLLADDYDVSVIPLVTQPWNSAEGSPGYEVFRLSLTATGRFDDLYGFIRRLEGGGFATLTTEAVTVTWLEAGEDKDDEDVPVRAVLSVAVYKQPPVAEGAASDA